MILTPILAFTYTTNSTPTTSQCYKPAISMPVAGLLETSFRSNIVNRIENSSSISRLHAIAFSMPVIGPLVRLTGLVPVATRRSTVATEQDFLVNKEKWEHWYFFGEAVPQWVLHRNETGGRWPALSPVA